MSHSEPDIDAIREQLTTAYRELPTLQQVIVQLMSVIYMPVTRAAIIPCLNHTGTRDKDGRAFVQQTLKPHLDHLQTKGVLLQEYGQNLQCHPLLAEIATRDAIQAGRFEAFVKAIETYMAIPQMRRDGPRMFVNELQLIREIRIAVYRHDVAAIQPILDDYAKYGYQRQRLPLEPILSLICTNPFDPDWFRTLPPELSAQALVSILQDSMMDLVPSREAIALLQEFVMQGEAVIALRLAAIEQLLLQGQFQTAQHQLEQLPAAYQGQSADLQGWIYFLQGEDERAIAYFTAALQAFRKVSNKRKGFFPGISGLFFILALIKQGTPDALHQAATYVAAGQQAKTWLSEIYDSFSSLIKIQQGDVAQRDYFLQTFTQRGECAFEMLFHDLCLYWVDLDQAKAIVPKSLEWFYQQSKAVGYHWLAMEAAELLGRFKPRSQYKKEAEAFRQVQGIRSLADLLQPREAWELSLTALTNLYQEPETKAKPATGKRLAWFITLTSKGTWTLQPREQSMTAKGEWGKGRPVALKRLKNDAADIEYLSSHDLQVITHLKQSYSYDYYYSSGEYQFDEKAIAALVGHPYVFWEDTPTVRIEVVKGEPELLVKKRGDRLTLQLSPQPKDKKDILVSKETPTRIKVIEITDEHRRIAAVLGDKNRLEVPAAAKDRVLSAINAVARIVTVQSDIGGGDTSAEEVPSNPKPHVHLLPAGEGLKVAVLSRPFYAAGPYYRPGAGGETVIAEIDGNRFQTTRNLKEEKQLAKAAIAACSVLVENPEQDGEWILDDPEVCLELLLELQALGDSIILEWPQGEKLKVSHRLGFQDFSLKIQRQNDWFATTGELKLDDDQVMDMQQLMNLLDQTNSRFIPLGNGEFLALTQEFRKRLDELRKVSEKSGKNLRIHPLAAVALEDWVDEVGSLKADKYWKAHIEKIKEIGDLDPVLPSTLQAELRDYQLDGFRWLARLAHWGVGACLADDMGLGKTLQSLAVILSRAPDGPTLVIAPTSVGMNWISEAERFAPTLNVIQFGSGTIANRQKVLDAVKPFDLVVCSYGLLQQEEVGEMLAKVQWQTIVLDEAQSIKNFATKRSQAAMNLQGGFKILTTGTPIENHLGELWNLFRFINPGLLGSLESFNQRFAVPIERYQDNQARLLLKKLIQPFILRRTKSQVLQELPSRTEILLQVELSKEEMAFYEALRRDAIAKLTESDANAGAKHLQVLAEIMKLRRACCNTQLVKPELSLPSSKLQLFGEVLTELLENRHKALVFSQFVDHLSLIRAYLDQQKITYQYLDGSTPAKERKKRVDAFQAGAGDVFLISLKAGGTGLNLTAADYVIHMDPWWNPAVEDQASDRAHRIGQQRPVTIYRLVAKGTIEEKIVDLHQHKRDLADSLLEGSDMSGKISTDELLRLIHEG
ncbi:MAG: SNF2-related protein [Leptolyngbyaceae cyanobacterium bins.349]|nr:SNF2-related protein [Leptolyngbyaceae cyanobacterium bins.349]